MTVPYYTANGITLHLGDSLDILPTLPDNSIDAIVTDPPYGLSDLPPATVTQAIAAWMAGDRTHVPNGRGFMGKDWDRFVPPPGVWDECLRVLKPGGHLAAFAGSRTVDLMMLSIRLAGFEIRDSIACWLYGSGFPKSLDVSKAIDKAAGAAREAVGERVYAGGHVQRSNGTDLGSLNDDGWQPTNGRTVTAPATADAARWQGWGTALKPAHEPIVLARKPLAGTVAGNVLAHGTGALNIDGCRVAAVDKAKFPEGYSKATGAAYAQDAYSKAWTAGSDTNPSSRWPSNVILTHPPLVDDEGDVVGDACAEGCVDGCPVAELDAQSGTRTSGRGVAKVQSGRKSGQGSWSSVTGMHTAETENTGIRDYGDNGGASRFFPVFRYEAKASAKERPRLPDGTAHNTVKPVALMSWLVRLVTPPGGTVLEPFAGSGTTLEACVLEGFEVIGIERHEPYAELCRVRLSKPIETTLFGTVA